MIDVRVSSLLRKAFQFKEKKIFEFLNAENYKFIKLGKYLN
jgi:hypothetical protein